MRSILIAGPGALAVALAITACGGGSSGASSSPTAPTGSTNSTISILGELGSQSFSPNPASVGGLMVVWRNNHTDTHRIVANDGSFDTGDLTPGATSALLEPASAGLNYHCSIHPTTMFGAIGSAGGGEPPPCEDPEYCE